MSTTTPNSPRLTSLGDIIASLFSDAVPCQMCGKRVPTYHDREKGSHYCLPCLEVAVEEAEAEGEAKWEAEWLAAPLEGGPEDPETVAYAMAFLDDYFASTARAQAA